MATMYYRPYTAEPIKDGELPPHSAIEDVLPEYQYIFVDPKHRANPPGQSIANGTSRAPEDLDRQTQSVVDYQMREIEKYRTAVHKMGQDILLLRQQQRELQGENSQLRRDISNYNDTTKLLMDSHELDGLPKPELAARYVAIKQKFTRQTALLKDYKDRVQSLQNELIKKNDREKQYLKMSHAHQSQNELLQRLQDKTQRVRNLEDVCRQQEKVIDKYERMRKAPPSPDKQTENLNESLMLENKRLRAQMEDLKDQQKYSSRLPSDETRQLELLERLEKSEGRVASLEKQLSENARHWSRERADLTTQLQEAQHGLRRTSPLDTDYRHFEGRRSYDRPKNEEPRRYSKHIPRPHRVSPKMNPLKNSLNY